MPFRTSKTSTDSCLERLRSLHQAEPPLELGGVELHQVYKFNLDDKVLDHVDKQSRLLFQMGSTQEGFAVVHQSLAAIFGGVSSVQILRLQDYPDKY